MPGFLARLFARTPPVRPPDYYERRTSELLETLLRPGGNTTSLRGEMIRHAYHLFDDGYRRGFAHWNPSGEAALEFLRRHLPDPRTFGADKIVAIHAALDHVIEAGPSAGLALPIADLRLLLHCAVDWCDRNPRR